MQELVTEDWHTLYGGEYSYSSQDGRTKPYEKRERRCRVGIRERVRHFTWPWFISTMSTGGLAIVLAETPHRFRGKFFFLHIAIILILDLNQVYAISAIALQF